MTVLRNLFLCQVFFIFPCSSFFLSLMSRLCQLCIYIYYVYFYSLGPPLRKQREKWRGRVLHIYVLYIGVYFCTNICRKRAMRWQGKGLLEMRWKIVEGLRLGWWKEWKVDWHRMNEVVYHLFIYVPFDVWCEILFVFSSLVGSIYHLLIIAKRGWEKSKK